jgi:hypothetical protein
MQVSVLPIGLFFVAEGGLFHDPFLGYLTKKKPCHAVTWRALFSQNEVN